MKFIYTFSLFFVLFPFSVWGQHKKGVEDILVYALRTQDTLRITTITSVPKIQLSFLMQGLRITILDTLKHPAISISFPDAGMVRDKIKHHPNEVKAMHRQTGDEVRPDLLPLIYALNDTCCVATSYDGQPISCSHSIVLDKTSGEMIFELSIIPPSSILLQDSIVVEIISSPVEIKSEFEGQRLSQENRMPPSGMGQPPKSNKDQNRISRFCKMLQIENSNE